WNMGTMGRRNQNRSFQRPGSQRPAGVLPSKSKIYALGSLRRGNGGIGSPPSNTGNKLETIPAHGTTLSHKQFLSRFIELAPSRPTVRIGGPHEGPLNPVRVRSLECPLESILLGHQ